MFVDFLCVCWLWCVFCFCVCWFCGLVADGRHVLLLAVAGCWLWVCCFCELCACWFCGVVCLLVFCVFAGFRVYFAFVFAGFLWLCCWWSTCSCCCWLLLSFFAVHFMLSLSPCSFFSCFLAFLFRFHFFLFTAFLIRIRLKHLKGIFHNFKQERSGAVVSVLGS